MEEETIERAPFQTGHCHAPVAGGSVWRIRCWPLRDYEGVHPLWAGWNLMELRFSWPTFIMHGICASGAETNSAPRWLFVIGAEPGFPLCETMLISTTNTAVRSFKKSAKGYAYI